MGKKSQPKEQTVTSSPWAPAQPYATDVMSKAQNLYNTQTPSFYSGQTYANFSPEQEQAMNMQANMARAGTPGVMDAINANAATARGDYLYGGSGFNAALDAAQRRIQPQVQSMFGKFGRSNSGLANIGMTQALADSFASQYGQERANQMNAIGMLPQMANLAYLDSNKLSEVGGFRQAMDQQGINEAMARHQFGQDSPWEQLQRYQAMTQPYLNAGGTQTSPLYQNKGAGMLGGAMAGAQIGSMFGPWGAAIGAIGGGILGRRG